MREGVERKRKFVGDVLWPFLKENTITVREAKMFCRVVINDVQSTFNEGMKAPLSTLKLEEKFDKEDSKGTIVYRKFIELFKDVPINETLELVDGLPNAIDAGLQFEDRDRALTELEYADGVLTAKKGNAVDGLLKETPICNDFRMLGDGTWVAYSMKYDDAEHVIRANGATLSEALINLRAKL